MYQLWLVDAEGRDCPQERYETFEEAFVTMQSYSFTAWLMGWQLYIEWQGQ